MQTPDCSLSAMRLGPIATEFKEVANRLTGELMARTDPDYKPISGQIPKCIPNR
ncbi:MAG: hypothetical protein V1689_05255 [Pseudomonadota bacterium]